MLAVEIELLTGRYVATAYNDRNVAEWPPHPARLYSALVATWATDGKSDEEKVALEWLAAEPPPRVFCPEAFPRTSVPVFVPVNDVQTVSEPWSARTALALAEAKAKQAADGGSREQAEKALMKAEERLASATRKQIAPPTKETEEDVKRSRAVLPESRGRQPRTFPSVTPVEPRFVVVWDSSPREEVREALEGLCSRLIRVGHSSSLVRARVINDVQGRSLVPDPDGLEVLRVPRVGQLDDLERAYQEHQEVEPRVLPCAFVRYSHGQTIPSEPIPQSAFGEDWLVFERLGGARFPMTAGIGLARALRSGLLRYADEPVPPTLTGHGSNGDPIEGPHLAIVAVPFVGSRFADGQILGLALIFPRGAEDEDRRSVLRAVGSWEEAARQDLGRSGMEAPPLKLTLGRAGAMTIRRIAFGRPSKLNLQTATWARPSRRWATATPIALDRNPGNLHHPDPQKRELAFAEAEDTVRLSCERIGLPQPAELDVLRSVLLPGSEKPVRFPRFPEDHERTQRLLVHARLSFARPVRGPVIVGAGRFVGLGLCRPLDGPERYE